MRFDLNPKLVPLLVGPQAPTAKQVLRIGMVPFECTGVYVGRTRRPRCIPPSTSCMAESASALPPPARTGLKVNPRAPEDLDALFADSELPYVNSI